MSALFSFFGLCIHKVDDEGNPGPDIESWQPACVNAKPPASSSSEDLDLDDAPTATADPLCPNTVAESGIPGVYLVTPLGQVGANPTVSDTLLSLLPVQELGSLDNSVHEDYF